jgi:catechol 1,2-dioxygenase
MNDRLSVIFDDVQRALGEVIERHQVTQAEFGAALGWLTTAAQEGELPLAALLFLGFPLLQANDGGAYTRPESDGASTWIPAGPAYVANAPILERPYVLPMRPDEPGEALVVSGTVRSTTGEPIAGALLDIWQTNAEGHYSDMTPEMVFPLVIHIDDSLPSFNLRGRLTTDDQGRYEYLTVIPGAEELGILDSGPLRALMTALDKVDERPRHIHALVTHDGFHDLTHQIHFDGDPELTRVTEGTVPAAVTYQAQAAAAPAHYATLTVDRPHRTLMCDYVLRSL